MTDYDDEQPTSWLELADEFAGLADDIDRGMRGQPVTGDGRGTYALGCANGYRTAAERIRYLLPRLGVRIGPIEARSATSPDELAEAVHEALSALRPTEGQAPDPSTDADEDPVSTDGPDDLEYRWLRQRDEARQAVSRTTGDHPAVQALREALSYESDGFPSVAGYIQDRLDVAQEEIDRLRPTPRVDPVDQHAQEAMNATIEKPLLPWPSRIIDITADEVLAELVERDPARFVDQVRAESREELREDGGRAAMWIQAGWSAARAAAMGLGEDAQVDAARRIVERRDGG